MDRVVEEVEVCDSVQQLVGDLENVFSLVVGDGTLDLRDHVPLRLLYRAA